LVHTLLFSVVLERNLTSFSPLFAHVFLLLLPLWFRFSFPHSLVVPAGLLHTLFCHSFSHVWHSLTLFSSIGFKRNACSWIVCFSLDRGKGLLQLLGLVLGRRGSPSLFFSTLYSLFTQESLHAGDLVGFYWEERGSVATMAAVVSKGDEEPPFLFPCIYSPYKCAGVFGHWTKVVLIPPF
jgi:hypothetical protein